METMQGNGKLGDVDSRQQQKSKTTIIRTTKLLFFNSQT